MPEGGVAVLGVGTKREVAGTARRKARDVWKRMPSLETEAWQQASSIQRCLASGPTILFNGLHSRSNTSRTEVKRKRKFNIGQIKSTLTLTRTCKLLLEHRFMP